MSFEVVKTLSMLFLPPAGLFIMMAAGFLILGFLRNLGKFLIAAGFILLYALSIGPVSEALLKPLETSAPPFAEKQVHVDAVIVLGGGVRDLSWLELPSQPSCTSLDRIVLGVSLYRKLHVPLVLVGGNGDPSRIKDGDADAMEHAALALGVPAKDIRVENKSKNTLEGAKALRKIITGKKLLLVTSAYHMKRAQAMFVKQGYTVLPAPAGYLEERTELSFYSFIPHSDALSASSMAIREYLSLIWYALHGDI